MAGERRTGRPHWHAIQIRRQLRMAFIAVLALFAASEAAALRRNRELRANTERIVNVTIRGLTLVSRMGRDLDRKRLLLDAHIFEQESVAMAAIEWHVAEVDADFAAAAAAYAPLASETGEGDAWRAVQQKVAELDAPIGEALALSRQERNEEARTAMRRLEGAFADLHARMERLILMDQSRAEASLRHSEALQRSLALHGLALSLAVLIVTAALGAWVLRLVQQRETDGARYFDELEHRNQELDAFAGRVAHDLRGPLTSIQLAAATLAQEAPRESAASEILKRGVVRMETLISDLLALSRIEEHMGVGDPAEAARRIRDEFAVRRDCREASLQLAVEPARVRCSDGLLFQVIWNLADNAVKYRRPDAEPEVDVRGRGAGQAYELRVSDNGAGMTPEEARHAFEPFFRSARVRHVPGTGLGLSIVRRVIDAAGGTISIESQLGMGTTFVIRLPFADRA